MIILCANTMRHSRASTYRAAQLQSWQSAASSSSTSLWNSFLVALCYSSCPRFCYFSKQTKRSLRNAKWRRNRLVRVWMSGGRRRRAGWRRRDAAQQRMQPSDAAAGQRWCEAVCACVGRSERDSLLLPLPPFPHTMCIWHFLLSTRDSLYCKKNYEIYIKLTHLETNVIGWLQNVQSSLTLTWSSSKIKPY